MIRIRLLLYAHLDVSGSVSVSNFTLINFKLSDISTCIHIIRYPGPTLKFHRLSGLWHGLACPCITLRTVTLQPAERTTMYCSLLHHYCGSSEFASPVNYKRRSRTIRIYISASMTQWKNIYLQRRLRGCSVQRIRQGCARTSLCKGMKDVNIIRYGLSIVSPLNRS